MTPAPPPAPPPHPAPPRVLLDTNVVLDWLYFDDPRSHGLGVAIRSGGLRWVATQAMCDELEQVLTREPFALDPYRAGAVLAAWSRWVEPLDVAPVTAAPGCRCSDPDDQKFIDLALHLGPATRLISRDRAVLRLAQAAARHGVLIVSLDDWRAEPEPALSG